MDIVTADWHPFEATSWVLPLLTSLSDWRSRLDEIQKGIYTDSNDTDAVFIADFPGSISLIFSNHLICKKC